MQGLDAALMHGPAPRPPLLAYLQRLTGWGWSELSSTAAETDRFVNFLRAQVTRGGGYAGQCLAARPRAGDTRTTPI